MAQNYDFIAIGDNATDAFIRLNEATVTCDDNHEHCMLCVKYADKIPYEEVYVVPAVGNSANAAVAAARLGLTSAFVSNVGDDLNGKDSLDALTKNNVSTDFISIQQGKKTNYHYVLWYLEDRTILIKHEMFDYTVPDIGSPKWIYLSSAAENSLSFHTELGKYLVAHPEVKLAFQPGTYQMRFGTDALKDLYQRSEVFICNKEEYQRVLKTEEDDIKQLLTMMKALGPKIAVLTDGIKGAYTYDGSEYLFMRHYPDPKPPYERTGAGDAFSSTFVAALALGKDIRIALKWGPINSMSVVQQVGAQAGLLTLSELEDWLKKAPEDYEPKAI
jgi:ribokinase